MDYNNIYCCNRRSIYAILLYTITGFVLSLTSLGQESLGRFYDTECDKGRFCVTKTKFLTFLRR